MLTMQLLAQLEQLLRMATQSWSIKIYTYMHHELTGESLPHLDSPVCCSCMALTRSKINHHTFRFFTAVYGVEAAVHAENDSA